MEKKIAKCCRTCRHWGRDEDPPFCKWPHPKLPFWANISNGDHADYTEAHQGTRCETWGPIMAEDTYYLTVSPDPEGGGVLALISRGHPKFKDEHVEVLDVALVKDQADAERWYQQEMLTKPWEDRS